jgi:arginyl-tRNA synthetase
MNKKPFNNFNAFKKDFKTDTGLKAEDNMALYIQYVNARLADWNMQINQKILEELSSPNSIMNDKLRY